MTIFLSEYFVNLLVFTGIMGIRSTVEKSYFDCGSSVVGSNPTICFGKYGVMVTYYVLFSPIVSYIIHFVRLSV